MRGGTPEASWESRVGDDPSVLASLTALIEDAAGHWSNLELPADRFVAHLVERMPGALASAAAIAAMHGRDLYLACACAHGDSAAIEAFVARFSADIERWSARAGLLGSEGSDALQDLHIDLFWPEPPRTPQIATYFGRAPLRAWLRAVTMHAAIKVRRGRPPSVSPGEREAPPASQAEAFSLAWATTGSPELVAMKSAAEASFEQAFSFAMGQLTPAERTLLRQRYLDGLTIDDLAPLHGAHRATMARMQSASEQHSPHAPPQHTCPASHCASDRQPQLAWVHVCDATSQHVPAVQSSSEQHSPTTHMPWFEGPESSGVSSALASPPELGSDVALASAAIGDGSDLQAPIAAMSAIAGQRPARWIVRALAPG